MHFHQARNKWSRLLRNDRISAVIENITIHFSLFFSQTHLSIYIYVCVCRENTLLLTGNPGYCNLPRLDSTCLSAVWYRVGHCCNWSRNAIALLIIEIINGPRYRVGSYSKYLDKSRYGIKEDVSRCSLSKIYIYMYARVPSWLSKKVVYIELIFISFTLAKREEENKVRVFFFFIIEIQRLLKFDFLNISLFFRILLLFLREISID